MSAKSYAPRFAFLQDSEDRRRRLTLMLQAAEEEADREGTVALDSVMAELDEMISAAGQ